MVRKILILVCVLGLVWVLYIGVEDDNDHRRPPKIKGVIIPPKKIGNTENQAIEPPGTLKARNNQREIEKEWIKCIEKRSRIYIIFKKAYINNKEKQNKVLRYLEDTYNLIEATLPEHTKKRNDERGEVIIRFKDVEKYKLGELEKLEKDVDSYVERLKEDKTLKEYIEEVELASFFIMEHTYSPCDYFRFHKKKQEDIKTNNGSFYFLPLIKGRTFGKSSLQQGPNDPLAYEPAQWATKLMTFLWMVWDKSKGEEIKIAAISDGVDYNHPDLCDKTSGKCNLLDSTKGAKDFAKGDNNPHDDCPYQYCNLLKGCKEETCSYPGTYSASIISALTNNNKGMAGMAPESQIIPLRVGVGNKEIITCHIAEAIDRVVSIKQARGFPQIIYTTYLPPCANIRLARCVANSIKEAVENGIVVILPTNPMCDLESQYIEVAGEFDEHGKLIT